MISFLLIALVAFGASLLTFFSGFGLGTILTPFFVLYFPLEIAIGITAIVHFLNNCFKVTLMWKNIHFPTVMKFAVGTIPAAVAGAYLLIYLSEHLDSYSYALSESIIFKPANVLVGLLMLAFSIFEIASTIEKNHTASFFKNMYLGGIISGFLGGLSGHQGALRTAFLIQSGLEKTVFIGTGICIALLVDISRLSIYSSRISSELLMEQSWFILTAVAAAFAGAMIGKASLKKVTFKAVQLTVGVAMMIMSVFIILGII